MEPVALAAIILAAGRGSRMKSALPKVLHPLCGLPMVAHVGRAVRGAGVVRPVVVVHPDAATAIRQALGDEEYLFAGQAEQLGTGHAALMAREALGSFSGRLLVVPGDAPLITSEALRDLLARHVKTRAAATVATFRASGEHTYGRVVRDGEGRPAGIVEHKDATPEQRSIEEVNSAVYVFDSQTLWRLLSGVGRANAAGEHYLTCVIAAIAAEGGRVEALCFEDPDLFLGCNDRWELARAARKMQNRIQRAHALAGVTIADPGSTWIGTEARLAEDVLIEPFTILDGATSVGRGSVIGPHATVKDSTIGQGCLVLHSHVTAATLEDGARCGPFAHLRPRTVLGAGARAGNFVEVKNATFGRGAKASHLAYIGDASVGAGANVGAGTITCNFDGIAKHRTEIGEGAFIGSNSTLVAPLTIGEGAFVAAGSTITRNVPKDALALGRARQEVKEQWAKQWRQRKREAMRSVKT
jgi:bifunctional UDP-N-acetylglucosamine pyrophosphorylase/glucosamine-1-phosphate N-acetyltransferase